MRRVALTISRDGEDRVRFRLGTKDAGNEVYEHKVERISEIKSRSKDVKGDD